MEAGAASDVRSILICISTDEQRAIARDLYRKLVAEAPANAEYRLPLYRGRRSIYGVDAFTPVINPPNAGILGVGRLRDDVTLENGEVATVKRLTLSLTWDHRVVDGVPAAEFCRAIVELLADPTRLD